MKKIFFILLIACVIKSQAQNKDYVIDMNGIGALKIGMSQLEVEKIISQKLILRNALDTAISMEDTATVKYKNISMLFRFLRQYTAEKIYYMSVTGIRTTSPLCKTIKGIGVGDDKLKVTAAYKKDRIQMVPEYNDDGHAIKNKYLMLLKNRSGERLMIFYLRYNKVVAIEVKMTFDDEE